MYKFFIFIFIFFLLVGCVKMRDFLGTKNGAFGIDIKKRFGEGIATKDYFITDDGIGVIVRDTKSEIIKKLGQPDSIEKIMDKRECWVYEKRNLKLFFDGEYLTYWSNVE